ncbi:hypothetical protein, partial [Microcoleus sp. Z1_B2]|uniref:hypothetical protein n=1 Tax=Microcoleus sp. Z1_B2 TaxID=3055429 RepID=UPI002FD5D321
RPPKKRKLLCHQRSKGDYTCGKNPFPQLMGLALGPIPQELFLLVGWAPKPVLIIFARGLLN